MVLPARQIFTRFGSLQTWIVGIQYYDGAKELNEPEVCFEREPDNPFDPNAIAVFTKTGVQIGHLPRHDAAHFAPLIDDGSIALAGCVTGPEKGGRIPLTVDAHATAKLSAILEPDTTDDWRAIVHNLFVALWPRLDAYSATTLSDFREHVRALAREQKIFPKTQFLYRMLKARIEERATKEEAEFWQRLLDATAGIAFGKPLGWPELAVIPLDAPAAPPPATADEAATLVPARLPGSDSARKLIHLLPARCPYLPGTHGICILIHGELYSIDWFSDPNSALVSWYSAIVDALESALSAESENGKKGPAPDARAQALEALTRSELSVNGGAASGETHVVLHGEALYGSAVFNGQQLLHLRLKADRVGFADQTSSITRNPSP